MSREIERSDVAPYNRVFIEKKARVNGEPESETLDKWVDGSNECRGIQEAADAAKGTDGGSGDGRVREEVERGALLRVLLADEDRKHPDASGGGLICAHRVGAPGSARLTSCGVMLQEWSTGAGCGRELTSEDAEHWRKYNPKTYITCNRTVRTNCEGNKKAGMRKEDEERGRKKKKKEERCKQRKERRARRAETHRKYLEVHDVGGLGRSRKARVRGRFAGPVWIVAVRWVSWVSGGDEREEEGGGKGRGTKGGGEGKKGREGRRKTGAPRTWGTARRGAHNTTRNGQWTDDGQRTTNDTHHAPVHFPYRPPSESIRHPENTQAQPMKKRKEKGTERRIPSVGRRGEGAEFSNANDADDTSNTDRRTHLDVVRLPHPLPRQGIGRGFPPAQGRGSAPRTPQHILRHGSLEPHATSALRHESSERRPYSVLHLHTESTSTPLRVRLDPANGTGKERKGEIEGGKKNARKVSKKRKKEERKKTKRNGSEKGTREGEERGREDRKRKE
ncbi:hypothetical protein B0H11DRAFT_1916485 [Mycena galericulata]|nr:hypothetical protein B0H11DRAFT_1916485 [Mycena galericulata]